MAGTDRVPRSHINAEGFAKISYDQAGAEREAVHLTTARGAPFSYYRCGQEPEHYHLAHGIPDLQATGNGPGRRDWLKAGEERGWSCKCGAWGVGHPYHGRCTLCRAPEPLRAGVRRCEAPRCASPSHRRRIEPPPVSGPQAIRWNGLGPWDAHLRTET